jgi:hypothetical protein
MTLSKTVSKYKYVAIALVVLLSFPLLQSCGIYTFSGAQVGNAKTISIGFIQNKANLVSPTLSQVFTEKLKDKFIRETTLKLVDSDGDMHIEGTIVDYAITPVALQGTTQSSQNRLTIKSNIKFVNKTAEKYDFDEVFQNFTDFDANINFSSEEATLNEVVIDRLVQDIFNKAVINW